MMKPLDDVHSNEFLYNGRPETSILLKKWAEFREQARSSHLVTYDSQNGFFKVSALNGRVVYTYTERIPSMEIKFSKIEGKTSIDRLDINSAELILIALQGKLNCGLELRKIYHKISTHDGGFLHNIHFYIDLDVAKQWLAFQLEVKDNRVIQGELKD